MEILYTTRVSKRARRMRITVKQGGEVVVTVPRRVTRFFVERFVRRQAQWITKRVEQMKLAPRSLLNTGSAREFKEKKAEAKRLVISRIRELNRHYGFSFRRVTIRNQKSRWGSCSRLGNLSFNYRIVSLPPAVADYLIVHELCHLREMNHSKKFWALVSQTTPQYRALRKALRGVMV